MPQSKLSTIKNLLLSNVEDMLILAFLLVNDRERANAIVETVLMELWEQEELLKDDKAIHKFLYARVKEEGETKRINWQSLDMQIQLS